MLLMLCLEAVVAQGYIYIWCNKGVDIFFRRVTAVVKLLMYLNLFSILQDRMSLGYTR